MKKKIAIVMFELVDESVVERNETILRELSNWFYEDAVSIPWVKEAKNIIVKEE